MADFVKNLKVEDNVASFELAGRIDSSNAASVEKEMLEVVSENSVKKVVIDKSYVLYSRGVQKCFD